jgi:hypothetical protein
MSRPDAAKLAHPGDGPSRRDFLHVGSLAMLGLGLPGVGALGARGASASGWEMSCILLFLIGGPSQLDTWDMKPDAPEEVRGPFRPIDTNVAGLQISEIFPRLAGTMDKVTLVRSVHHTGAAVHDVGHQMMQTGRLFGGGIEHPHYGCALAKLKGPRGGLPPHVLLPRPIGATGANMPHGQGAGYLGEPFEPYVLDADPNTGGPLPQSSSAAAREAFDLGSEPEPLRDRYGRTRFGQSCLLARRLVERGVRFVTVNMYETVFNQTTWDIHGSPPFSPIDCYRDEVGPNFDNAYTALLEDLARRGLLGNTMVLAFGEFGRTPKINPAGGRDHHPGCWTALFAGGPIRGGQAVGASDATGSSPKDRPVTPAEVAATVYEGLGISLDTELPGPEGRPIRIVDQGVEPIRELL